jgi:hypothetical protein
LSVTEGLLTVSTTTLQGVAILEIVVNDPDNSDTVNDVVALAASVGGTDYDLTQASNGKWYVYVVDKSQAVIFDATSTGLEFGVLCESGMGKAESSTDLIVSASIDVYASVLATSGQTGSDGSCLDVDGMVGVLDTASSTARQDLTAAVLQGAPSVSDPDGDSANLGQRAHGLNATSGYGTWPYIIAVDLNDDNEVAYGSDAINVVYGNTDDETSISLANRNPGDRAEIHLTFADPALNIDPTTADKWLFDLSDNGGGASASTVEFANNGTTNTALSAAQLGEMGCVSNCALSCLIK